MAIYSCDHDGFIVVYEDAKGKIDCPVCAKDTEINDLESEVEDLKSQIE